MGQKYPYYVVFIGRKPGVYTNVEQFKKQIDGFPGASFKGFFSKEEAYDALYDKTDVLYHTKQEIKQTAFLSSKDMFSNIYVDGSYYDETNEYSAAFVVVENNKITYEWSKKGKNKEMGKMLNSLSGEIMAASAAAAYAAKSKKKNVFIYYDNIMVADLYYKEKEARNEYTKKYVDFLESLAHEHKMKIEFVKVKSHNGNRFNDYVDQLAKKALFGSRKKKTGTSLQSIKKKMKQIDKWLECFEKEIYQYRIKKYQDIKKQIQKKNNVTAEQKKQIKKLYYSLSELQKKYEKIVKEFSYKQMFHHIKKLAISIWNKQTSLSNWYKSFILRVVKEHKTIQSFQNLTDQQKFYIHRAVENQKQIKQAV